MYLCVSCDVKTRERKGLDAETSNQGSELSCLLSENWLRTSFMITYESHL